MYSYDEETGFTKETTVDSISVPASFIYNAEDGSFKTEFGGNANSTYMFKTVENKVEKFYIAMNILYNGSEKPSYLIYGKSQTMLLIISKKMELLLLT